MRWIYLSPHPDDAALCAGGLIYEQRRAGEAVQIWTLMSGAPASHALSSFAAEMHAKWGTGTAEATVALRRAEDLQAAEILKAQLVHFGFVDAIYRRGPNGGELYSDPVGASISPADAQLPARMSRELDLGLLPNDKVVCLLGIGDHVDHVLVRRAAEMLGRTLLYVADFPYVLRHPDSVTAKTGNLRASVQLVSEGGLEAWIGAVETYRSQLGAVFDDLEVRSAIRDYWAMAGGIRVWEALPAAAA